MSEVANGLLKYDHARISALSKRLQDGLLALEHATLNGSPDHRYPGCVNISFAYVEGERLLMGLNEVAQRRFRQDRAGHRRVLRNR